MHPTGSYFINVIAFNGSADHDCEKNVKMNFRLWESRVFLWKINCIFTITSKDSGHSGTVQVPVS